MGMMSRDSSACSYMFPLGQYSLLSQVRQRPPGQGRRNSKPTTDGCASGQVPGSRQAGGTMSPRLAKITGRCPIEVPEQPSTNSYVVGGNYLLPQLWTDPRHRPRRQPGPEGHDMKTLYVSIDIEADGPIPGRNSMLSLGTAVFDLQNADPRVPIDLYETNLIPLPEA